MFGRPQHHTPPAGGSHPRLPGQRVAVPAGHPYRLVVRGSAASRNDHGHHRTGAASARAGGSPRGQPTERSVDGSGVRYRLVVLGEPVPHEAPAGSPGVVFLEHSGRWRAAESARGIAADLGDCSDRRPSPSRCRSVNRFVPADGARSLRQSAERVRDPGPAGNRQDDGPRPDGGDVGPHGPSGHGRCSNASGRQQRLVRDPFLLPGQAACEGWR